MSERVVTLLVQIERGILAIVGVYAPEEGRKQETQFYYEMLQREVNKYKISDRLIIAGYLNSHSSIVNENGK